MESFFVYSIQRDYNSLGEGTLLENFELLYNSVTNKSSLKDIEFHAELNRFQSYLVIINIPVYAIMPI